MFNNNKTVVFLVFILFISLASFAILTYKFYSAKKQIPQTTNTVLSINNKFPGLQVTLNENEFTLLAAKTQFFNLKKEVLNNVSVIEYRPKNIILNFESMPSVNPGYINSFRSNGRDLHAFKVTEQNQDYVINFYLGNDFYNNSSVSEVDDSLEQLITYSLIYLGEVHKNKAKLTQDQINSLFSLLKNHESKYNTINVKKI